MTGDEENKILIAAGGSGGHLFPAIALADGLKQLNSSYDVAFIGKNLHSNRFFDSSVYQSYDISGATPFVKGRLASFFEIGKGIFQSLKLLRSIKPSVVVGFGSYHAFPALAAALLLRVPIILFESNLYPGKVIRLFSRFALCTAVQFEETSAYLKGKIISVAMPLRQETAGMTKEQALASYGLKPNRWTLLIFGGSQGAVHLNRLLSKAICQLSETSIQVIHVAGNEGQVAELQSDYERAGIPACVKIFEKQMAVAWTAADSAVCRSGAGTVAEIIHFAKPSLMIPFPHGADDHQTKNALFISEKIGGGLSMKESQFDEERFKGAIRQLRNQEARLMMSALKKYRKERPKETLIELVTRFKEEI